MSELTPMEVPPTPQTKRAPPRWPILLTLALVGAIAAGLYWLKARPAPGETAAHEVPPATVVPATPSAVQVDEQAAEAGWRGAVAGLSSDAEFRSWIEQPGLLRRMVGAVGAVAEGESPRPLLAFLAPKGSFAVKTDGERRVIDPQSYARYDFVTRVLGTIDVALVGAAYAKVAPYAEGLYSEMAPAGQNFRGALRGAVKRLADVPIVEGDVEVIEEGVKVLYADPKLESLPPAEKHLLRMGPTNARKIQAQLAAFEAAIGK